MTRGTLLALALLAVAPAGAQETIPLTPNRDADAAITAWTDAHLVELLQDYHHYHAHPELSFEERETSERLAVGLQTAGYGVTRAVGGTGIVGVLENGDGPTLLLRGDMDALPVTEQTGLPYASTVVAQRPDGTSVGVMHACGHDVHVANLLGTARLLAEKRDLWSGTLVVVGQPAEEIGQGARAMIADGLFERFPRPDYAVALHVTPDLLAGQVGVGHGFTAANVDSIDVVLHGRGGHGAYPHTAVDPVVAAASLVTALQTLVSRRIDPIEPAVVTVGAIHGGSKHNVIPDEVLLQLTVRSYSDEVRAQLVDGVRQLAEDTCRTFLCPKPPDVRVRDEYTPAVYNDPALSRPAEALLRELLGAERVVEVRPTMGGEDFGRFARELGIPALLYRLGSVDPEHQARSREPGGEPLPSLHSARFAPDPVPTLRTGLRTLANLAVALLPRSTR